MRDVACRGCGHGFTDHQTAGGTCTVLGRRPDGTFGECQCRGFRWVDPAGQAVGSYTDPPRSVQ